MPLVFGNLSAGLITPMLIGSPVPGDAEAVSRHFRHAWTSFAASGDPGWPNYDLASRQVAIFHTTRTVSVYPEERSRRLWAGHDFAALPLLGRRD